MVCCDPLRSVTCSSPPRSRTWRPSQPEASTPHFLPPTTFDLMFVALFTRRRAQLQQNFPFQQKETINHPYRNVHRGAVKTNHFEAKKKKKEDAQIYFQLEDYGSQLLILACPRKVFWLHSSVEPFLASGAFFSNVCTFHHLKLQILLGTKMRACPVFASSYDRTLSNGWKSPCFSTPGPKIRQVWD